MTLRFFVCVTWASSS